MKNFNDLIADPSFQLGASLLGQSGNPNAMASAFANMRAINQLKQERELAQQRLAQEGSYQQGELDLGKQRNSIAEKQYARENDMTQQQINNMLRQQMMQQNFFRAIAPRLGLDPSLFAMPQGGQQPMQPPSPQAPPIPPAAMPGGEPPRFVPQLPGGAQIEQIPTPPAQPFRGGNPAQSYPTSATPASILDNLAQVESSGNPRAVNPQSGAMGMYQFMPSTVAALRKQGVTFDPFNPQQARQAADYYLAQLYSKHGSWEKALADYGGFKTKDPTNYVSRVMAGTAAPPAQQTGAQAQPMPNQGLDLAQIGAAAAMMGIPGGSGLIEVGKMQQPQNVPAGSYQRNPVTGETNFVGDPYREHTLKNEDTRLGLEQQRLGMEASKNQREAAQSTLALAEGNRKLTREYATDTMGYQNMMDKLDSVQHLAQDTLSSPGLKYNTGGYGALGIGRIPGTEAHNAFVNIEQLKSKMKIELMQELKSLSKSGSTGMGQMSDAEGKTLETYWANLDRAQTEPQMRKAITEIANWARGAQQRYTQQYGTIYGKDAQDVITRATRGAPLGAPAPTGGVMSLDDYIKKHSQ